MDRHDRQESAGLDLRASTENFEKLPVEMYQFADIFLHWESIFRTPPFFSRRRRFERVYGGIGELGRKGEKSNFSDFPPEKDEEEQKRLLTGKKVFGNANGDSNDYSTIPMKSKTDYFPGTRMRVRVWGTGKNSVFNFP